MQHALRGGVTAGIVAALAHGVAVGLYACLAVSGLLVLITALPWLFLGIQLAGAVFLIYLGLKSLLAKPTTQAKVDALEAAAVSHLASAFRDGFTVAFLNPKLALFFTALFSQFLSPDMSAGGKLVMVATITTIDAGWYCLVAVLLTRPRWQATLLSSARLIDSVFGSLLLLVGFRLFYLTLIAYA